MIKTKLIYTYRLLNLEESLEKKLMRPGWGDSPGTPPVAEYSKAVLFRGLVWPMFGYVCAYSSNMLTNKRYRGLGEEIETKTKISKMKNINLKK